MISSAEPLGGYRGKSSLGRLTKVSSSFDEPSKKGNFNQNGKDPMLSPTKDVKAHIEYSHQGGGGIEPRPWNSLYLKKYFQ